MSVASICSQVTASNYRKVLVKLLHIGVSHAHATRSLGLCMHSLDSATLQIMVYPDASFSNNSDRSTQLGSLVLFTDKTARGRLI